MANNKKDIVQMQIGKNGLTQGFIDQARKILITEESVRISILKSACRDKKEADEMCQKLVDALGKNYVYRLVGYVCILHRFRKNVRE